MFQNQHPYKTVCPVCLAYTSLVERDQVLAVYKKEHRLRNQERQHRQFCVVRPFTRYSRIRGEFLFLCVEYLRYCIYTMNRIIHVCLGNNALHALLTPFTLVVIT